MGVQEKVPEVELIDAPLGALLAKLYLTFSIEESVIPTINCSVFPSSIVWVLMDFISKTSCFSTGVDELSFDEAPTPIPLIAETL